ncbi:MAG: hypothetical protein M1819_006740 [Sarea resinae]|nr:MAG: hypothetical protein M1819_006740 [Sarea resinae]
MKLLSLPWSPAIVLLATASLNALCASAGAAVNVALNASFNAAPFLIELLETAAEENATCYFPVLDRIAEGYFASAATDEELFTAFLKLLKDDGHIAAEEDLASFQFALSIHSTAPRIEAHYQFYKTAVEPSLKTSQGSSCTVWAYFQGKQYCSPTLEAPDADFGSSGHPEELPFDRVLGSAPKELTSILYADINSPEFGKFHTTMSRTARDEKTSYRIRYKPTLSKIEQPLVVSGYGVELALKRTDYIVIDDRDSETNRSEGESENAGKGLGEEMTADLKPLSSKELLNLGVKASSFVMSSENPFETLLKLSLDFPKFSSVISTHETSEEFMAEFRHNRNILLPAGFNIIWINGVQADARQIDAYALLEHLRRERKLVKSLKELGLSGSEAVKLLSSPEIAEAKAEDDPQRYDWRDDLEGGKVIIWMNDVENDKRYAGWSSNPTALLQRTYPGQLPSVRRDIHNIIVPMDFSSPKEVAMAVEVIQGFIKRSVPIRFGLVPTTRTMSAESQAKVAYHLLDTYGLAALLHYLEASLSAKEISKPSKAIFDSTVKDREPREQESASSLQELLRSDALQTRLDEAKTYLERLGAANGAAPIFVNGVTVARNDDWLQIMSARVTTDLRAIQRGVFEEVFQPDTWFPGHFLSKAVERRNPLVIPEDESTIKIVDVGRVQEKLNYGTNEFPQLPIADGIPKEDWAQLFLVADIASGEGLQLLSEGAAFHQGHPSVELTVVHNPRDSTSLQPDLEQEEGAISSLLRWERDIEKKHEKSEAFWEHRKALVESLGLRPGQQGLVLNGRLLGPITGSSSFSKEDFELLLQYERKKRIGPLNAAISALGLEDKVESPFKAAWLSSIIAFSAASDVPEGIFQSASTLRIDAFDQWESDHTAIVTGDSSDASINIVAAIDPASEMAQRWIPILKTISELSGVHMKLFLNPKEKLQELPIKRFYRHVLESKPTFNEDGSLWSPIASFTALPEEALLTIGMDVPPSWLVAPKESIHDLDNIKLSLTRGADVEATYELEHILIEGHSRDITTGEAPRGAQLVLGTEEDPHFADTIVMANLGYFQFKANPGFWKLGLQAGRTQKIFSLDSAGTKGYSPQLGDESPEIALTSFQGKTIFPRLSRKQGQEEEDVLEATAPKPGSPMHYVSKAFQFTEDLLSQAGISTTGSASTEHADINIFSVASGHLYERMLNIMMVSVMKHTKHSVKFWFIEQFLSPSFKSFLPHVAAHYGFSYEMVTFKWPHWLRAQKEKQREIWGYKILFLDVLFPLNLEKVIFVDADQIVRTDMYDLVTLDLHGAPYGFTPMCSSRTEMDGFRFWNQGYWKSFLRGRPYHISALYVVDLRRFRALAAGDRLRQQYHQLSADANSLSNLDQDLPNHMQAVLPIYSLPQEWLWCETWCSDESLKEARTIDLCNNPLTKEPKLDRARRQVPEWGVYDEEIAVLAKRVRGGEEGDTTATISSGGGDDGSDVPESSASAASPSTENGGKDGHVVRDEL